MKNFRLDKLDVTGEIDDTMPICVLKEILDSHRIICEEKYFTKTKYLVNIIRKIYECDIEVVQIPPSDEDLSKIAAFINNKEEFWDTKSLTKAFKYYIKYSKGIKQISLHSQFQQQSKNNANSINNCFLYKYLKDKKIIMNRHTTHLDMLNYLKLLNFDKESLTQRLLKEVPTFSKTKLINCLKNCTIKTKQKSVKYTDLLHYHRCLENLSRLYKAITPANNVEAIGLCAKNYCIDISNEKFPMETYKGIRNKTITESKKYLSLPRLNTHFNELFPESYYTKEDLDIMFYNEGYTKEDLTGSSVYYMLQMSLITYNIYYGFVGNITNKTTPIYYEKKEDIKKDVFSLGVISNETQFITVEELKDLFKNTREYTNPFNMQEILNKRCVRKIKLLCKKNNLIELLETIREIEFIKKHINKEDAKFLSFYNNTTYINKEKIRENLKLLMNLSMYMRGWKGAQEKMPITEALNPDPIGTDFRSSKTLLLLDKKSKEVKNFNILNLRLVRYKNGTYTTSDIENGLTIKDRLEIIRKNENATACIRMSSNWLASSAYKYMKIIGLKPPFNIKKLRHIY